MYLSISIWDLLNSRSKTSQPDLVQAPPLPPNMVQVAAISESPKAYPSNFIPTSPFSTHVPPGPPFLNCFFYLMHESHHTYLPLPPPQLWDLPESEKSHRARKCPTFFCSWRWTVGKDGREWVGQGSTNCGAFRHINPSNPAGIRGPLGPTGGLTLVTDTSKIVLHVVFAQFALFQRWRKARLAIWIMDNELMMD